MDSGITQLQVLRRRWIAYEIAACVLLAFAIASVVFSIINLLSAMVLFIISLAVALYIRQPWKITDNKVSSLLNLYYPQLEESCDLVLKPYDELNLLERFQVAKVEAALLHLNEQPKQISKHLRQSGIFLVLLLAVSFAIAKSGISFDLTSKIATHRADSIVKTIPEKVLPQIESQQISVTPPAYTGKAKREQSQFTLNVEEGSEVKWDIKTNIAVKQVSLLFNETENIRLKASSNYTEFTGQQTISKPGFYQVAIDGKLSDLYQVEVLKDAPPVIRIITPKPYTFIDVGEKPQVNITTQVSDDYGVSNALLMATVAKGSGEAVKFKEYKLQFANSFNEHKPKYDLQKLVDLKALDMEPGDELYFYILATDNHNQQSRTDAYTVTIQDTAALMSMNGIVAGTDLKPEFFRSERQIIIDSEHLLKEKDTISAEKFNGLSNDLGVDQKLLRLRYGKFLGEESESNIGGPEEGVSDPKDFSNINKIMDEYTDKHDNAEDAGLFEPAIKAQLKATLTEMWNAELHLRMYKPQDALAFEYKALRLLKDLQQKSRSYVAKTSYNPPPLKMEKRLSGELKKIVEPDLHYSMKAADNPYLAMQNAVPVLEQLKSGVVINGASLHTLQLAEQQLSSRATAQPAEYISSVSAMRRILASPKQVQVTDIGRVEKAIQFTLQTAKAMPNANATQDDMGLAQQYYKNLDK